MNETEIQQVIKRAVAGEPAAFRALLDHHYLTIFRMAFRFTGNKSDAEDVTQMTCMKLAQSIGQFDGRAAFTTWLYQVVLNTARDWQRAQSRHQRGGIEIGAVENTLSTTENAEKSLEVQQQLAAVRALPEGEREAIWLVYAEGLSHKQAADILGCAEGTISYRIQEARKKLTNREQKHG